MTKRVNIIDIARKTGYSIATVSYVINNTKKVSDTARKEIESAIRKLGYKPDMLARSFKTRKTYLIGFIVPDISNPFFSTLIEEVESVIAARGYGLVVFNTKETKKRELQCLDTVSNNSFVEGLLIASTLDSYADLEKSLDPSLPAVFVDRIVPGCTRDTVSVTCYDSVCEGVEYLIGKGNKKIGYITGLSRISTTAERLRAYVETMKKHGLYDPDLVQVGNSMSHCVRSRLTSLLKSGCTAVVITNNVMGTEAMSQMFSQGLLPGKDIEILSFKDSDHAQYGLQHINLIDQPTAELGKKAGEMILERIENPDAPARNVLLKSAFVPKKKATPFPAFPSS